MTYMGVGWLAHQLVQLYTANVADQRSSAVTSASWFTFHVHVFRLPSEGEANAFVLVIWGTLGLCQTIATGFSSVNAASCFTFPAEKNMWQGWHLQQCWNGTKNSVKLAQKVNHPGMPYWHCIWPMECLPDQMWKRQSALYALFTTPHPPPLYLQYAIQYRMGEVHGKEWNKCCCHLLKLDAGNISGKDWREKTERCTVDRAEAVGK